MRWTRQHALFFLIWNLHPSLINAFVAPALHTSSALVTIDSVHPFSRASTSVARKRLPTFLRNKTWNRLEIQEDTEPRWYLLNCVAGSELDLLNQCRSKCAHLEDYERFVVPISKSTRSHGSKRIITETKVRYKGYVFAKLRLCPETYETIRNLDLCRSWMGTVNQRGNRKLPPAPVPLNSLEIQEFGLEEIVDGSEEQAELEAAAAASNVILDSEEEESKEELKMTKQKEDLKVYQGLRVDDMVKVTGNKKFLNEDGIVKRLKDGKIKVRFFTFGSMYDEWLNPDDVRKMSNEEVLRGLSGPSTPLMYDDINRRGRGGESSGNLRSSLMRNVKGYKGERNRRQDRMDRGDRMRRGDPFDRTEQEWTEEERNWQWYQEQGRNNNRRGPSDGRYENRGRSGGRYDNRAGNRDRDGYRNQRDVDAQWGRNSKRRQQIQRGPNQENRRVGDAIDGADDWSAFVTPAASSQSSSNKGDDDFFNTLMSDLSGEMNENKEKALRKKNDGDDFFESLMSDLEGNNGDNRRQSRQAVDSKEEDDFFAALEAELANVDGPTSGSTKDDGTDEFFVTLEAELSSSNSGESNFLESIGTAETAAKRVAKMNDGPKDKEFGFEFARAKETVAPQDEELDFFSQLEAELGGSGLGLEADSDEGTKKDRSSEGDLFNFNSVDDKPAGTVVNDAVAEAETDDAVAQLEADDFFSSLEMELDSLSGNKEDFLQIEDADGEVEEIVSVEEEKRDKHKSKPPPNVETSPFSSTLDAGELGKKTVPVLKDMLRDRGLKVSGKKAELIERLMLS